jgi:hypothetical protein
LGSLAKTLTAVNLGGSSLEKDEVKIWPKGEERESGKMLFYIVSHSPSRNMEKETCQRFCLHPSNLKLTMLEKMLLKKNTCAHVPR